jgi:cytochrome c oxidase subunit 2
VPPGKDAYILAARYTFYPELVLKAGHRYRIWLSAADALHGFSLVGGGQNLNLQIAPNHAYGVSFVPAKPGTYLIVCNEYCGLGHHHMTGRITVTS